MDTVDFDITSSSFISVAFREKGIHSFRKACDYVKQLPYRRNSDKTYLLCVFTENCGTCSTKHALLKQLAEENNATDIKLVLGIFKMNGSNTPAVKQILDEAGLNHIPEAHNYLKAKNEVIDCA